MSHVVCNVLHAELNIWQEMVHCSISSLTDTSSGITTEGGRFNIDTFEKWFHTVIALIWFLQKT